MYLQAAWDKRILETCISEAAHEVLEDYSLIPIYNFYIYQMVASCQIAITPQHQQLL